MQCKSTSLDAAKSAGKNAKNSTIKTTTKLIIIALYFALSTAKVYGSTEQFRFTHIGIKQGLSNSSVNCFYQDHLGYMWIGTENGLNRYDGLRFRQFQHNNSPSSISNNRINCIYEDSRQLLLIGNNKGISIYDRSSNTFKNLVLNSPVPVNVIYEDTQHNIWFGTDHGQLHLLNLKHLTSTIYFNNEVNVHFSSNAITSIAEDNNGNLMIGRSNTGLNVFNIGLKKFIKYYRSSSSGLAGDGIQGLYFNKKSNIMWIATNKGLNKFYPTSSTFKRYTFGETQDQLGQLRTITINDDGTLWIGSENKGVYHFDPVNESTHLITTNVLNINSLSNDQCRTTYCDREGNLWIGCFRGGINLLTRTQEFSVYQQTAGASQTLSGKIVLSVIEDRNTNLWIGSDGEGLNFVNRKTGQFTHYKKGGMNDITGNSIQCLYEDIEGKIWIGTAADGLCIYHPTSRTFTRPIFNDKLPQRGANDIRAITCDKNGQIWVASNGNGLSKFNIKAENTANYKTDWYNRDHSISTNWIRTLHVDRKNNLWIGTVAGLSIFNLSTNELRNVFSTNDNQMTIYALCEDNEGTMWLGTSVGLQKYNSNAHTFQTYGIPDGLPDNVILGILSDDKKNLWISTNKGLSSFNYQTKKIVNFDFEDGLPSDEFISNAAFKGVKNQMYFGSADGLLSFNPHRIKTASTIPPLYLSDFKIFNKSVVIGAADSILKSDVALCSKISLEHDQAFFSFEFSTPHYSNPQKNKYRYKLKNFDKQWIYNESSNSATYTNVAPGNYIFMVENSVEKGVWTSRPVSIQVQILPPFWRSSWAYFCYITMLGLALYALRKFIIYKEGLKSAVIVEKLKLEKAEEINGMKLNFLTNVSHEFKTPLSLIIGPAEQLTQKDISEQKKNYYAELILRNSQRLLQLINEILDLNKIDAEKLQVHKKTGDIADFIKNTANTFRFSAEQKKIKFKIEIVPQHIQCLFDAAKIEIIVLNLLSNAFKFTPENGQIEISLQKVRHAESPYLLLQVKDNGDGISPKDLPHIFERFYKAGSATANATGTGIGLAYVKELVSLHKGKIEVASNAASGTLFSVYLPLYTENDDDIEVESLPIATEVSHQKPEAAQGQLRILLIEDNDDVRTFLKGELEGEYIIEEANNGKKGLEKAFQSIPDIVISDVMMPEMNGTELCSQLKKDIRTSHIPVILLSAKTSVESQVQGFENGADAYVAKPYNFAVLQLQIKNILSHREKLRKKVTIDSMIDAKEITVTNADEKLMIKAIKIIEDNLNNPEFSVNIFASEIGISRSLFYTKLKSITGQTINDFIQTIRLKHAANLLLKSEQSVADIAHAVGFNSTKYFTKCFKEAFGIHPAQYKVSKNDHAS